MKALTHFPISGNTRGPIVTPEQEQGTKATWKSFVFDGWERIKLAFASCQEPHVWQTRDRAGHILWKAYDPATEQSICFGSEAEVRQWIETRYYC